MIWPQTKWTIIVNFTFKKINSGEPFGPAQWLDHKSNGKSLRLKSGKRFLRVLMSWAMFLTNPPPEFTFSSSLSISCLASLVIAMMSNQGISYDFLELQYTQTSWIVFKWCDGEQLASGCLHIGQAISKTFGILTQVQLLHIYMSRPILNLEGFKKSVCCKDFRKVRFAICFYVTSNCSNQVAWTSNQELITNLHILIKKRMWWNPHCRQVDAQISNIVCIIQAICTFLGGTLFHCSTPQKHCWFPRFLVVVVARSWGAWLIIPFH